jgi:CHAD domain-containing protein
MRLAKAELDCNMAIRRYASRQTATLLRRLAYQVSLASQHGGPDAVHDLRVSIRRLMQSLRVFSSLFPHGKAKRVRQDLKIMLELASEVRNLDITPVLLTKAKLLSQSGLAAQLAAERREAQRALSVALKHWISRDSSRKWRSALGL